MSKEAIVSPMWLKTLRQSMGLTQAAMAATIGVTSGTYRRLEDDHHSVRLIHLMAFKQVEREYDLELQARDRPR